MNSRVTEHAIDKFIKINTPSRERVRKALLKLFANAVKVSIPPNKIVTRLINNSKGRDFKDAEVEYYENGGYRFVISNNTMITVEKKNY